MNKDLAKEIKIVLNLLRDRNIGIIEVVRPHINEVGNYSFLLTTSEGIELTYQRPMKSSLQLLRKNDHYFSRIVCTRKDRRNKKVRELLEANKAPNNYIVLEVL